MNNKKMKRFELRRNTVFDAKTGLEWDREESDLIPWQKAMDSIATGKGWRMPSIEELISLIDYSLVDPATEFPNMPLGWFWSSLPYANDVSRMGHLLQLRQRVSPRQERYVPCSSRSRPGSGVENELAGETKSGA
jgi:hypothetical protein